MKINYYAIIMYKKRADRNQNLSFDFLNRSIKRLKRCYNMNLGFVYAQIQIC